MANKLVRRLRDNPTDAERALWQQLRMKQIGGVRFRRQYPLGSYVVDFVCLKQRLIIEIDGGQHIVQIQADGSRTAWLENQGFKVIRFWNNEVLENMEGVLTTILAYLDR